MKTLLNIETFGIRLYYIEPIDCDLLLEWRDAYKKGLYVFEYDDTEVPMEYSYHYKTLDEALGEIVNHILNPENWTRLDEAPENLQRAYELAGVPVGVNPTRPEITNSVASFLYYILDGIAHSNE